MCVSPFMYTYFIPKYLIPKIVVISNLENPSRKNGLYVSGYEIYIHPISMDLADHLLLFQFRYYFPCAD